MAILVTGGAGYVGVGIARQLLERKETPILFDVVPVSNYPTDIKKQVKTIQGDLGIWSEVLNVIKENEVEGIFHFGAMLGVPSDVNPWASFQTNVAGTMHILEAARLFGVNV